MKETSTDKAEYRLIVIFIFLLFSETTLICAKLYMICH